MAGRPRKDYAPVVVTCHWQDPSTGSVCGAEITGTVAYCEKHEAFMPTGAPGPGVDAVISRHGQHSWYG